MKCIGVSIGTFLLLVNIALAQVAPERTWGLCIGIGDYQENDLRLNWADKDAIDFCTAFLENTLNVPDEHRRIVKDRSATQREIRNALNWLTGETNPEDRVYIFYSGHGKDTSPILPCDADNQLPLAEIKSRLKKIPAREILVFIDACYSGRLADKSAKFDITQRDLTGWTAPMIDAAAQAKIGTVVMTSAKGIQESVEDERLENGLFTSFLNNILTKPEFSRKADSNHDGQLTLDEVYEAVYQDVTTFPKSKQQPQISNKQLAQQIVLLTYAVPTPEPTATPTPTPTPTSVPSTPTPTPVQTATLSVRVNVSGAEVRIDGQPASANPATLALGWHTVRVSKAGYLTYEDEIELNYDRTLRVDLRRATVLSEAIPTPEPAATVTPTPTPPPEISDTPSPTPAEEPAPGTVWRDEVSGMDFVWIPAGQFQMGSPDGEGASDEHPQHPVTFASGFWMGQKEVTQAQWKKIMGSNPSYFKGESNPVETISWNDAQAFIAQLNQQAGKEMYRLPSEAEWEYACRAGTHTAYSFGDNEKKLGDYAWYSANSGNTTHPVRTKKPNAWKLYDMHGNLWEWCADTWHDNYQNAPSDGSVWGSLGDEKANRLLRGGSWDDSPTGVRGAYRFHNSPAYRYHDYGMRVVCVR